MNSSAYFDPSQPFFDRYRYSDATFEVERVTFNELFTASRLRGVLARMANRNPKSYEARLSQLAPLDELTFRLRTLE